MIKKMNKNNSKKVFVRKIFDDVAKKYDLMNDLMSIGFHRFWKKKFIDEINLKNKKNKILDLGSGTGDIIFELLKQKKMSNSLMVTFFIAVQRFPGSISIILSIRING